MSYEEPPLRRSRYLRFTADLSSCVCIGVYGCLWASYVVIGVWVLIGVYRYLRESMGVHGFSDVNQRQRVL